MSEPSQQMLFDVFNEIGIIDQLARALLEARLPDGLITPHFTVVNHLLRLGDGRTPIEIARAFQVPKTSMTHTIKVLEAKGYVEVRPNPGDGRSKCVFLTDKGRALPGLAVSKMTPDIAHVMQGLDVSKLVEITPVLRQLRETLDAERNARDGFV